MKHYENLKGDEGLRIHRKIAEDAEARQDAIKRAMKLDVAVQRDATACHKQNPVTKVYLLFKELESWIA